MPPKEITHSQILPSDVLSTLPPNVIDNILLRLPCKDAVRTSILSTEWRHHWCRLTELTLDESLWSADEDLQDPTVEFSKFCYQFITRHEGSIFKFTLDISDLRGFPEIDNFIYYLSRNGITHLVLHLPEYRLFKLPSSVFRCSQLTHLNLQGCLMDPPSTFKGFDKLISLELYLVTMSIELLKNLESHCPLLEQLVWVMLDDADSVDINAPMLKSFGFTGVISSVCLKNVPRLLKVSLTSFDMSAQHLDFAKVFKSCPALEYLLINFSNFALNAEEGYQVPTRLPFDLNRVKRFYITSMLLIESSHELSFAFCLIRSFPCLEYLKIEVYSAKDDNRILESLELEHFSDMTLNYLREVELKCYAGTPCEMQLIKLLLAKSPVLVKMLIDRRSGLLETRVNLFDEVSSFILASPKAEVVYID